CSVFSCRRQRERDRAIADASISSATRHDSLRRVTMNDPETTTTGKAWGTNAARRRLSITDVLVEPKGLELLTPHCQSRSLGAADLLVMFTWVNASPPTVTHPESPCLPHVSGTDLARQYRSSGRCPNKRPRRCERVSRPR